MKCQHCGAEVLEGAAFCQSCGKSLRSAPPAPPIGKEHFAAAVGNRQRPDDDREAVLWEGQFSKLAMIGAWVGAGTFTLAAVVVGAMAGFDGQSWTIAVGLIIAVWFVLLLRLLYLQYTVHYSLTTQRFVHERGLLWRQVDRIETIDIDDVTVSQGPIERMLGVGTVRVMSSDKTSPEFQLVGIEDVRRVATIIDEARRNERRKRGLHIESV
jgi:membrane protein YdbS with pleckstrin-like domain